MKLHSDTITTADVLKALAEAQRKGRVAADIECVQLETAGSRSRRFGYKIQLGTHDKTSSPTSSHRHYKNSGTSGAGSVWAATYDEWGWFIVELLHIDADAVFGPYKGLASFHEQTGHRFS